MQSPSIVRAVAAYGGRNLVRTNGVVSRHAVLTTFARSLTGDAKRSRSSDAEDDRKLNFSENLSFSWIPGLLPTGPVAYKAGQKFATKLYDWITMRGNKLPGIRVLVDETNKQVVLFPLNRLAEEHIKPLMIDEKNVILVTGVCPDTGNEYSMTHQLPADGNFEKAKVTQFLYRGDLVVTFTGFKRETIKVEVAGEDKCSGE